MRSTFCGPYICLVGNNIPQDILQALTVAIQQNSDRQVTFEEHRLKTEALTRELEMFQEHKRMEVCIYDKKCLVTQNTQPHQNTTEKAFDSLRLPLILCGEWGGKISMKSDEGASLTFWGSKFVVWFLYIMTIYGISWYVLYAS